MPLFALAISWQPPDYTRPPRPTRTRIGKGGIPTRSSTFSVLRFDHGKRPLVEEECSAASVPPSRTMPLERSVMRSAVGSCTVVLQSQAKRTVCRRLVWLVAHLERILQSEFHLPVIRGRAGYRCRTREIYRNLTRAARQSEIRMVKEIEKLSAE